MDTYDTEGSGVVGRRDSSRMFASSQTSRRASGTMTDVYLDESGVRRPQRTSKIFLEQPMYSQEAEKKRHRRICSTIIFFCFIALGVGIFINTKMGPSKAPPAALDATVIAEEEAKTGTTDSVDVDDDVDVVAAYEEEEAAIEEEEQAVIEEESKVDNQDQADLLAQEADVLEEEDEDVKEEQSIMEEMDEAETEEEIDLLNEEAEIVELEEDNLETQSELLDQAASEDGPNQVQELEDEVEQLELQETNLQDQLDAEIAQEDKLAADNEEEGGERRYLKGFSN